MEFLKRIFPKAVPVLVAVVIFFVISAICFAPQFEGRKIVMHDIQQFDGMSSDIRNHRATHGEDPQWTGAMFGGMPAYLIDVSYPAQLVVQTIGRAARNLNGLAIFYADSMTGSMQKTIEETERRREKQMRYNMEHGITPTQIQKARTMTNLLEIQKEIGDKRAYVEVEAPSMKVADPIIDAMTPQQLKKAIDTTRKRMQEAAKKLDFPLAAQLRDEMLRMMNMLEGLESGER